MQKTSLIDFDVHREKLNEPKVKNELSVLTFPPSEKPPKKVKGISMLS